MLLLLLVLSAPPDGCRLPDVLAGRGRFERWGTGPEVNDVEGWERTSSGNGAQRTGGYGSRYAVAFQTVYGPAIYSTDATVTGSDHVLSAYMWGEFERTVAVRVRDLTSGHYLNRAGGWQETETDALVQDVAGAQYAPYSLTFSPEAGDRTLRVEVRSNRFGTLEPNGFYSCLPSYSCPAGAVDLLRLCPK